MASKGRRHGTEPRGRTATAASAEVAAGLRSFLETAPFPVFAVDVRGRPVAWNAQAARITGYDAGTLAKLGWRALFPHASARRAWSRELAERRTAQFSDWTWDIRTRAGERRRLAWSSWRAGPPDPGWVTWGVGRDVTALCHAEERLQRERASLRAAEVVAGFGHWDFEPATGRVDWSEALERLYGLEPGTFRGNYADFLAFIHPQDRAAYERYVRERTAARASSYEQEFRIVRRDGAVRWIRSRAVELRDAVGRTTRMVGVNMDVTDSRRVADELEQTSEYLRTALKTARLVLFHQDRQLRYTWIQNPALGVSERDLLGRTDAEIIGGRNARPLTEVKRRVLRSGIGERSEVWVSREDRRGCYDLVVEPQRDASGRVTGIVCAALDVTDRALATRELEETRRELQRLAGHLQVAVEEERREIARDVHDQVGAMLTALRMSLAQLAADPARREAPPRAALEHAQVLAERASRSTRDICARLRPPTLDELGIAETCRWYLRDWSRSTGLRYAGRFARLDAEPAPDVGIDLFRALQELLTNVARHSGAGSVRAELGVVRGALRLRVADDGHGFVPDAAARRGIGLASVRERAARHGGRMDIRSGRGGDGGHRHGAAAGRGVKARLIIADDHAVLRQGLRDLVAQTPDLEIVAEAVDGAEAESLARSRPAELLLLDIALPVRRGLQVLESLRSDGVALPVLLFSMYPANPFADYARRAGAQGFVSKAAGSAELLAAIRRVLGGRTSFPRRIPASVPPAERADSPFEQLSRRETDVLLGLLEGASLVEIGRRVGISPKSVTTYRRRLFDKLGVQSNAELATLAARHGQVALHGVGEA